MTTYPVIWNTPYTRATLSGGQEDLGCGRSMGDLVRYCSPAPRGVWRVGGWARLAGLAARNQQQFFLTTDASKASNDMRYHTKRTTIRIICSFIAKARTAVRVSLLPAARPAFGGCGGIWDSFRGAGRKQHHLSH